MKGLLPHNGRLVEPPTPPLISISTPEPSLYGPAPPYNASLQEKAEFYQHLATQQPRVADGWFGLSEVLLSIGNLQCAVPYLVKGNELDPNYGIGSLVVRCVNSQPQQVYRLARLCMRTKTEPGYRCAITLFDECLSLPNLTAQLYLKVSKRRGELYNRLTRQQILGDNHMKAARSRALNEGLPYWIMRLLRRVAFVALVGFLLMRYWSMLHTNLPHQHRSEPDPVSRVDATSRLCYRLDDNSKGVPASCRYSSMLARGVNINSSS